MQIIKYMDTVQIERHFFLAAFAEMTLLAAIIATIRAKKKLPRKKFRTLITVEMLSFWLLGTVLLAIGLALWVSMDL